MKKKVSEGEIVTVVPNHIEIDKGTLLEIIRQSRLTKEDFMNFL